VSKHPLSVQLYTVRDAVALDLDAALARLAAIGFRTVELYGFVERAAEYRDTLAKHGLVASSAHAPFLSQDAAPIFAAASEVGVTSLIDPMSDPALWTTRDGIASLAAIGFRTVELYGFVDRATEYRDLLAKHGLVASSAHAPFLSQDAAPIFAAATEVGVTSLIDPMSDPELWTTRDGIASLAATLNERAKQAAEHGIRVGYHNHWWEPAPIDGTPALAIFADLLDPEVFLEVDTYWVEVGGGNAVEMLGRLGERVQFIHVKDGDISENNKAQVAVGDGRMPVLDILAAAPQAVPVVELDDFDGDVFDAITDSFAYLTANGETA